ncbi:MAG: MarR family winged helix-turn-helix transcriptional regulator [Sulfurimonadaceae bacterium]
MQKIVFLNIIQNGNGKEKYLLALTIVVLTSKYLPIIILHAKEKTMEFNMDRSLGFVLNKTALFSKSAFNEKIKGFGITPEQWSLVFRIVERSPLSQKELSECTYKDGANIARTLERLEQKGFVERIQNKEDRRSVLLYPTQKAHDLVAQVVPISQRFNEELTQGFSQTESEMLLGLLSKLENNLTQGEHNGSNE